MGDPTSFDIDMPALDPSSDRAFLVYSLFGLSDFTSVPRAINGGWIQGRVAPALPGTGGLQVEEIPANVLREGRNLVQFLPADAKATGEYRVQHLRIVTVSGVGRTASLGPAELSEGASFSGGFFHLDRVSQPMELAFRLDHPTSGSLTFAGARTGEVQLELEGLDAGWHTLPGVDRLADAAGYQLALSGEVSRGAVGGAVFSAQPIPETQPPEIVLSAPGRTRCLDGLAYVRGFVRGGDAELSAMVVNGQPVSAISPLGEFETVVRQHGSGVDWEIQVAAELTDGRLLRESMAMRPCVASAGPVAQPRGLQADVGAPYGDVVTPEAGGVLEFGGATLEIPPGAVKDATLVTIRPLAKEDVAPLGRGMTNTSPAEGGFRFGPHGIQFEKPIKITLPYDERAIPPAGSERHVTGYYYDEAVGQWQTVGRFGEARDGVLVSLSDHFTDFITATIPTPDAPGAKSFNPNEMQGIEMASPAAGVTQIHPPTANPQGTANVSYPLELPPGRRGMQPQLAITYSSAGGNSWLGKGWNLGLSSIEFDTRYGVPDYDGQYLQADGRSSRGGRLVPLLDGAQLVLVDDSGADHIYQRRVEGSFQRIVLRAAGTEGAYWEVTNQDGTKFIYGQSAPAKIADPNQREHIFRWHIERVEDTFGNGIAYQYHHDESPLPGGNGTQVVQCYPETITYTTFGGDPGSGSYRVDFLRGAERADKRLDGRAGFLIAENHLLEEVRVSLVLSGESEQLIRSYGLEYETSALQQTLLSRVAEHGRSGQTFYSNDFEYHQMGTFLSDDFEWDAVQSDVEKSSHHRGKGWRQQHSGEGSIGFPGLNGKAGYSLFLGETKVKGITGDYTGDGTFDVVSQGGTAALGSWPNFDTTFAFQSGNLGGLHSQRGLGFSTTDGWSLTPVGGQVGPLAGSFSFGRSAQRDKYVNLDMDGDGLVDSVWIDDGTVRVALSDGDGFLQAVDWNRGGGEFFPEFLGADAEDEGYYADADADSYSIQPLIRWNAPRGGYVDISGTITKLRAGGNDGVDIYVNKNAQEIWTGTIGADDLSACHIRDSNGCGSSPSPLQVNVHPGDNIYFRVDSKGDPRFDEVEFLPSIAYTTSTGEQEAYGALVDEFYLGSDFRGFGGARLYWTSSGPGTVDIYGSVAKWETADEVTLKVYDVDQADDPPTRTLVDEMHLSSGAESGNFDIYDVDIAAGHALEFEIDSDVPIDPARIAWFPKVDYVKFFRPDPANDFALVEGDVVASTSDTYDSSATPDGSEEEIFYFITGDPTPDEPIAPELLFTEAPVNYQPLLWEAGVRTASYEVSADGSVQVTGTVSRGGEPGDVFFACQSVHELLYKRKIESHEQGNIEIDIAIPDLDEGQRVSCSLYSKTYVTLSAMGFGNSEGFEGNFTVNLRRPSETTSFHRFGGWSPLPEAEILGGGFHRWSFGDYRGDRTFDPSQIRYSKLDDDHPDFIPAVPNGWREDEVRGFQNRGGAYTQGPELQASLGPVIQPGQMTPRTGDAVGASGGLDQLRASRTWHFVKENSIGYGGASAGLAITTSNNKSRMDLVDMNGDGLPDAISNDGVRYNTGCPADYKEDTATRSTCEGGFTGTNSNLGGTFRRNGTNQTTSSAGLSSSFPGYNNTKIEKNARGKDRGSISAGFSVGTGYATTSATHDLIDVNGDGLLDFVRWDGDNYKVRLNLGYTRTEEIEWSSIPEIGTGDYFDDLADGGNAFAQAINGYAVEQLNDGAIFLEKVRASSPSFNDVASANVGVSIGGEINGGVVGGGGSVSVGYAHSMARDLSTMLDVTGDGLPDFITKNVQGDGLLVYINRGTTFSDPVNWNLGGFDDYVMSGFEEGVSAIFANPQEGIESLGFTRSSDYQVSVSVKVCFWFVCISGTDTHTQASSHTESGFRDIDGDGFVDLVLKQHKQPGVFARRNLLRNVDLLKTVHGPLGGSFDIEYERAGNTFDQQSSRIVMSQVTVRSGVGTAPSAGESTYDYTYEYDQSGYYSRHEREFYAFSSVTTTRPDGVEARSSFENGDFYRRGLAAANVLHAAGTDLRKTASFYNGPVSDFDDTPDSQASDPDLFYYDGVGTGAGLVSVYPAELEREMTYREVGSTDFKATREARSWDPVHGGVETFFREGDREDGDPSDSLTYSIEYEQAGDRNLPNGTYYVRASEISAVGGDGVEYRRRSAVHDDYGAVVSVTDYITGGRNPGGGTYTLEPRTVTIDERDIYGNVLETTDPVGYHLSYGYDDDTHTHVTSTTDSFGYTSTGSPNLLYGTPAVVQDINLQQTNFVYDDFGRMSEVWGPKDQGTTVPTITFAYASLTDGSFPRWAKTGHKDIFRNDENAPAASHDFIETVTLVDGMERVIQTKKDLEKDFGDHLEVGMTVSGRVIFDAVGRIQDVHQPVFSTDGATTFVEAPVNNDTHTRTLYDYLDRVTLVNTPHEFTDGSLGRMSTTTQYGFATDGGGILRFSTRVKDPIQEELQIDGKLALRDIDDSIVEVHEWNDIDGQYTELVTSYEYNPVDELLSVADAHGNVTTSEYDTVGRMIALDSPDMGRTEWAYDVGGNLREKETARLRDLGQVVSYNYTFNRLENIDYPETLDKVYVYGEAFEAGSQYGNVAGRIKREISEAGTRDLRYDELGNTTNMTMSFVRMREPHLGNYDQTVQYEFDSFARAKKAKFPGIGNEVITYAYDAGGNVQSAFGINTTVNEQHPDEPFHSDYLIHIGYDEFGQRVRTISGNFIETKYEYKEGTRRLDGVIAFHQDEADRQQNKAGRFFQVLNYEYDKVGNVHQMRNDAPYDEQMNASVLVGTLEHNYSYDKLYQLTSATGRMQSRNDWAYRYVYTQSYDEIGNIQVKDQSSFRIVPDGGSWRDDYEEPDLSVVQTYTYGSSRPHAPTEISERTSNENQDYIRSVQYDDSGNQTRWDFRGQNRQIEWNEDDQIKRITKNGQELNHTLYDAQGQKAVHLHYVSGMEETAYLGPNLTIRDGKYLTKHVYVGDQRVSSKMDPEWFQYPPTLYFHPDHLGSTQYVSNDDQTLVQHDEFFPSGEPWRDETDSKYELARRYVFTGKELDIHTGLYDYGARSYDARMGVWLSPDPILVRYMRGEVNGGVGTPRNLGLYTYAWNNPSTLFDETGLAPDDPNNPISLYGRAVLEVSVPVVGPVPLSRVSLYDVIVSSKNLKPKTVEELAESGSLRYNFAFRGAVGELVAMKAILHENLELSGNANLAQPLDHPELQQATPTDGGFFDFGIAIPGDCGNGCPGGARLTNSIGRGTNGRVGTVDLGSNPLGLNVEVTTSEYFPHLLSRAEKVGKAQAAYDAAGGGSHAALAIDADVYRSRLTRQERQSLRASAGGGTIILVDNLREDTRRNAQTIENWLR